MILRRKVLAAIIVTLAALTVLLFGLARISFVQRFVDVEADITRQNLVSVLSTLDTLGDSIRATCIDNASWDDTYEYVVNRNQEYINKNFSLDAITVPIDIVMILNNANEILYSIAIPNKNYSNSEERVLVTLDPEVLNHLRDLATRYSGSTGLTAVNDQAMLLTIQPILMSGGVGPSRGNMIFADLLDAGMLDKIRYDTKLQINWKPITSDQSNSKAISNQSGFGSGSENNFQLRYLSSQRLFASVEQQGLDEKSVLEISLEADRTIYQGGVQSLYYMLLGALIVGLATSLLGYAVFESLVMQPVLQLDSRVRSIADSGKLGTRVALEGVGAFAPLATNINDMLSGLERAQRSLLESEARFRIMVENAPEAIIVIDNDLSRCVEVNQKALQIFGYSNREQFFKHTLQELILPAESRLASPNQTLEQMTRRALDGETIVAEVEIRNSKGSETPSEIRLVRFPGEERNLLRATLTDISERKQAEMRLLQAQKLESLGLLAGGIAHDFNNLLTGMLGQTSLALRRLPADNPARTNIEKAMKSAERAAIMTRQLLAYAGRSAVRFELVDINQMVNETVSLVESTVAKNVKLQIDLGASLPGIAADIGQLQQVMMNLIINAAQAIPPGKSGKVAVSTRLHHFSAGDEQHFVDNRQLVLGDYVCLQVVDNGLGMDEATVQRIFDPFFTTKAAGNGLGLASTLGIMRTHQGAVQLDTELGSGTTFSLYFPAQAILSNGPPPANKVSNRIVRGVVLVIDDELPVRETARDILESNGITVLVADNGRAGIAQFMEHQQEIDAVIIDMRMPIMNGAETLSELRQIDPTVRVILSSGYNESYSAQKLIQLGEAAFLPKPYDSESLIAKVQEIIQRAE